MKNLTPKEAKDLESISTLMEKEGTTFGINYSYVGEAVDLVEEFEASAQNQTDQGYISPNSIFISGDLLTLPTDSKQQKNFLLYAENLPSIILCLLKDEELQSYVIEYRKDWYEDKPLNWKTHLIVWLKTWKFILIEIIWEQSIAKIKNHFQPLHKPRLLRK